MKFLTNSLDKIASILEKEGLVKLAAEIDELSNTLESAVLPHTKDKPSPIFSSGSSKVTDGADHFPIPDKAHARNALARANAFSEAPSWFKGSLEELKNTVVKAVKAKFPGIEVDEQAYKG